MARTTTRDGWDDDEPDDWEEDGADWEPDDEDDSEPVTVPCPYCREPIYEDAEYCPACDRYLSREDAPSGPKPIWLIVGVAAGLVAICLLIW